MVVIKEQAPTEKYAGKWAHLNCEHVELHEPTLSPYEQLRQLTLIADVDEAFMNEDSQYSGVTTSSSYSRVSSFVPVPSVSSGSSSKKRSADEDLRSADDDFKTPERKYVTITFIYPQRESGCAHTTTLHFILIQQHLLYFRTTTNKKETCGER